MKYLLLLWEIFLPRGSCEFKFPLFHQQKKKIMLIATTRTVANKKDTNIKIQKKIYTFSHKKISELFSKKHILKGGTQMIIFNKFFHFFFCFYLFIREQSDSNYLLFAIDINLTAKKWGLSGEVE